MPFIFTRGGGLHNSTAGRRRLSCEVAPCYYTIFLQTVIIVLSIATTAKVTIIMTGDADTSRPRLLVDPKRKICQAAGIDTFVVSCPRSLGNLQHIRVWHDNSGKHPKWFLNRLAVKDMTDNRMFFFMLDKWLAVEEDDGQVRASIDFPNIMIQIMIAEYILQVLYK